MGPLSVQVREGEPIQKALKRLKKKIEKQGVTKDIRKNMFFIKPSEARRMKHKAAIRRARKRAQLEGI